MPRSEFLPYVAASSVASTSKTPPPDDRPQPNGDQPSKSPTKPVPNFSPPKRKHIVSVKGKERERELGGGEGSSIVHGLIGAGGGPVTWRHLTTDKVGPANPLRTIVHIDIDAAYAGMEMSRLGIPWNSDIPLCVQQWQGLIAVNYPARKFGITRHESPASALEKCPHLTMVHCATYGPGDTEPNYDHEDPKPETHKISLDYYRKESLKIIAVFKEHSDVVEKASIDESFLDLSLRVRALLLARYPALATTPPGASQEDEVPSPAELGVTIDWDAIGNVIPVPGDEGENKLALTWADVALAAAAELAAKARKDVLDTLGYTCSAGIAPNKMLAKLGSGYKKPNAQTILRPAAVASFIGPMPFQKIGKLGGKLGDTVRETFPAETVDQLLAIDLEDLQDKLGADSGMWLWEIIRGIDSTAVEARIVTSSMLASKNFRPSIQTLDKIQPWLGILATELYHRLTEARELREGLWPKTIGLSWRPPFTYAITKSHQAPFPFTSNLTVEYITKRANLLLATALAAGGFDAKDGTRQMVMGNMALNFAALEEREEGQAGIEGFFAAGGGNKFKADGAVKPVKRQRSEAKLDTSSSIPTPLGDAAPAALTIPSSPVADILTFTCKRCKKAVTVSGAGEGTEEDKVKRAEEEHADFHFARDLLEGERKAGREKPKKLKIEEGAGGKKKVGASGSGSGAKAGKVKEDGQRSLAGFFKKK